MITNDRPISLQTFKSSSEVRNQKFEKERLIDTRLISCVFHNSEFAGLDLVNVNFECSIFKDCRFQNCNFESNNFRTARFIDCKFLTCKFINSRLIDTDFNEVNFDDSIFDNCILGKAWFEKCSFMETEFQNIKPTSIFETAVVDSKFSKFSKVISFKGEYFLLDLLYTDSGKGQAIDSMFRP